MKSYIYKEVKYSLTYGHSFTAQGMARAKNFIISMLEKGIPPVSMHLLFCPEGFICHNSKANGQVLMVKESNGGSKKYWVSKGKAIDNKLISVLITVLFLLAILSQL
ncbi:hypothetical protein [Psychromonas sp. Urea-02u-13]|uniref:hypothetical protein n=1 Tax=Psychromonas sp. Urea-02u-13 TaxID=2058326 RepID=UPI000C33763B|nr:hypothetical protein [Psychromonas sp. Urea-02u-13]PKG37702.1 hypothetical protein CXF74_17350 [Psychromonas sp. Urea-02u-13]